MGRNPDVLVVGAGVIGLLCAYELSRQGIAVTVVDAGEMARECSWAGGGIVSPLYPWRHPASVTALSQYARQAYPVLSDQLKASTGIDIELHNSGLLILDPPDSVPAIRWAKQHRLPVDFLSAGMVHDRLATLQTPIGKGLWFSELYQLRPPRLLQALIQCLRDDPLVQLLPHNPMQQWLLVGDRIQGVQCHNGPVMADTVVLAAGAWSAKLLEPLGYQVQLQPVKGQMIALRPENMPCSHLLLYRNHYLIPRQDGLLLVGSTLEHTGFDNRVSVDAKNKLFAFASGLFPELAESQIMAHWSGLRPGNARGIPWLQQAPSHLGLIWAFGHFRNGLVNAPATAQVVSSILQGTESAFSLSDFRNGV